MGTGWNWGSGSSSGEYDEGQSLGTGWNWGSGSSSGEYDEGQSLGTGWNWGSGSSSGEYMRVMPPLYTGRMSLYNSGDTAVAALGQKGEGIYVFVE